MKTTPTADTSTNRTQIQPSKAGDRKPGQVLVSAWMDKEMLAQLDELALAHDRKRSDMLRRLIKEAVSKPKG